MDTPLCYVLLSLCLVNNCDSLKEGKTSSSLMPMESSWPSSSSEDYHCAAVSILDLFQGSKQSNITMKGKIHKILDCFPVLYTCICFSLKIMGSFQENNGHQLWEFSNRILSH